MDIVQSVFWFFVFHENKTKREAKKWNNKNKINVVWMSYMSIRAHRLHNIRFFHLICLSFSSFPSIPPFQCPFNIIGCHSQNKQTNFLKSEKKVKNKKKNWKREKTDHKERERIIVIGINTTEKKIESSWYV